MSNSLHAARFSGALGILLLLGLSSAGADPDSPPNGPPITISLQRIDDNHEMVKLLAEYDDFIPTTTASIKVTFNGAPGTAVVRCSVEGLDRDGFQVKKFSLPDVLVAKDSKSSVSRLIDVHTDMLRRIATWKVVDAQVIPDSWRMSLKSIQTKVVKAASGDKLYVRADCVNDAGHGVPPVVAIQGLDAAGYAVFDLTLAESSATRWLVDGNRVAIESTDGSTFGIERVRQWQALPNPEFSGLQRFLDADLPAN